jgi:hypothetical protein
MPLKSTPNSLYEAVAHAVAEFRDTDTMATRVDSACFLEIVGKTVTLETSLYVRRTKSALPSLVSRAAECGPASDSPHGEPCCYGSTYQPK